MSKKQAYEKKLEAQLDEWSAEIDKLKAKAKKKQANAEIDYQKQLDELKSKQKHAKQKLSDIKAASDAAWEDLKSGTEEAWRSLSDSLKSARAKFK